MALEGNLSDMPLIDLMQVFQSGRRTGRLFLTQAGLRAMLWFLDGRIINAAIVQAQTDTVVQIGEEAVFSMLQWPDASFVFWPPRPNETTHVTITRSTDWLMLEGLRRREAQAHPIIETGLTPQTKVRLVAQFHPHDSSISLNLEEWRTMSRVVSETTVAQVAAETNFSINETLALLGRLIVLGLIEVVPAPIIATERPRPAIAAPDPAASMPNLSGLRGLVNAIKQRLHLIGT